MKIMSLKEVEKLPGNFVTCNFFKLFLIKAQ